MSDGPLQHGRSFTLAGVSWIEPINPCYAHPRSPVRLGLWLTLPRWSFLAVLKSRLSHPLTVTSFPTLSTPHSFLIAVTDPNADTARTR